MGWAILAAVGLGAAGLLWLIGLPRQLWAFIGAGMMLGATGYALQAPPFLPGQPTKAEVAKIDVDPALISLRESMVGRFTADTAYLTAADSMTRIGAKGSAVKVTLGGIEHFPRSFALWTGLGTSLAIHDGDVVSPASLFAFRQAARIAPQHPAPPFFLGLAYIRAGDFAAARPYWAHALALAPEGTGYHKEIAVRLDLLDRYLAMVAAGGQ